MDQNRIKQLHDKYYRGETTEEEEKELFESSNNEALNAENAFYQATKLLELPDSFDEDLKIILHQDRGGKIRRIWPELSRIAVVLFIGILIGVLINNSKKSYQTTMQEVVTIALADQHSVHMRLKGLELAAQMPVLEEELLNSLTNLLNNDENVNIRIAALDLLMRPKNDNIETTLFDALFQQESILVQSIIIKYLLALEDPKIKEAIWDKLENAALDEQRKKQIRSLIRI